MMGNQNGAFSVIEFYILVCSYRVYWVLINERNTLVFIFVWRYLPRVLTMNINEMTMELLVEENNALKCQSEELRQALIMLFNGGWDDDHNNEISKIVKYVLDFTSEQCLESIKAEACRAGFMASDVGCNGEYREDYADAVVDEYLYSSYGNRITRY